MKKKEIVDHIVRTTTVTRSQAIRTCDSVIEAMASSLSKGESIYLRGFATLKVVKKKQRRARLFKDGKNVIIPAYYAVKFKACETLKKRMNQS